MDQDLLQRLLALMNEGELTELEYEDEGARIRLARLSESAPVVMHAAAPAPVAAPAAAAPPAAAAAPPAADAEQAGTSLVRAPMVGTFYASPSPETDAYVQVGDRVGSDSVLCILEAMKVMNEIKAEVSGEIVAVLVENGEPVEYDQPLFRVKT